MDSRANGFSLIEVIVVITIVALLATMALPQLHRAILPSHRHMMQAELLLIAQQLEQSYALDRRYSRIELSPFPEEQPRYKLSLFISSDEQAFTLRAEPLDEQLEDGVITLDSFGEKRLYSTSGESYVSW